MNKYNLVTDFTEIVAGTSNRIVPAYQEAVKDLDGDNAKTLGYIKNFIVSIESIAAKTKDIRISETKGNISQFSGYKNITTAIEFMEKNISGISIVKDLKTIKDALESMKEQYMDGYTKQLRLIMLEYESALYLLVTGLAMTMANNVDVVQTGTEIKITKKTVTDHGVIVKSIQEMAKQLSGKNHKEYLSELLNAKSESGVKKEIKEQTIFESSISDTLDLIDSLSSGISKIGRTGKMLFIKLKNSLFGIIPLIRSALYLKYKKKADTILALEQQMQFIELNIDQLKNIQKMDPAKKEEIVKKQRAVVEAYRKKAEKLRAQLLDTEKEASTAIKSENPNMQKDSSDEFILESAGIGCWGQTNSQVLFEKSETTNIKISKEIKAKAISMVNNLLESKWTNLELKASVGETSYSIEFFVDIKGKRKQCYELVDNKIIDEKEMDKAFEKFSKFIRTLPDYVKGNSNKLKIDVEGSGGGADE